MDAALKRAWLAAREQWVTVGRHQFLVRRPTEMQIAKWQGQRALDVTFEIVSKCVFGWRGVTEADLIPGGASDELEFDAEAFGHLASDRPDIWRPLSEAVWQMVADYRARLEKTQGN